MIFFVGNDGTVISSVPSPVYQGSANANNIYLVAPFAANLSVMVAFKLPNGVWTNRYLMTPLNAIEGVVNKETGKPYAGWSFAMPNELTQYYGTVTAQFFFYAAQRGVVTASSSTSFTVAKGVPEILPDAPTDIVYNQIVNNISALQGQVKNGAFAARAIYAWRLSSTYGVNELVYYPDEGEHGVFLKSLTDNNTSAPYTDRVLDSENWEVVTDFNILNDLYDLKEETQAALLQSQQNAQAAAQSATNAANSSQNAVESAQTAENAAQRVEAAAEYLESVQDGTAAVPKAVADDTGQNIAEQFATVNSDIEGLREDITNESHFRGMFESVVALKAAYPTATPNDYAYIVGGNQWIYTDGEWTDSNKPSPNTAVPKGTATPLMDGVASVGDSNTYADALHRHPSDTNKANLSGAAFAGNISAPRVTGSTGVYDGTERVYSANNPPPKPTYTLLYSGRPGLKGANIPNITNKDLLIIATYEDGDENMVDVQFFVTTKAFWSERILIYFVDDQENFDAIRLETSNIKADSLLTIHLYEIK